MVHYLHYHHQVYSMCLKRKREREREKANFSSFMTVHVFSVIQSCPTLCNCLDSSLSGSSVYGVFQARILEWIAISSSRVSLWPKDQTHVSCIGRQILYHWTTWESLFYETYNLVLKVNHSHINHKTKS